MLCTYGVPLPFMFGNYIKKTGKSMKAMGLLNHGNIIIPGCTTQEKVKNDQKLQQKLRRKAEKMMRRIKNE